MPESAHAEPFRPFRIHMASGRTFDILHPEFIKVMKNDVLVYKAGGGSPELPDENQGVSLMLAGSVSHLEASVRRAT